MTSTVYVVAAAGFSPAFVVTVNPEALWLLMPQLGFVEVMKGAYPTKFPFVS